MHEGSLSLVQMGWVMLGVIVEPDATIAFAGKRVIEETLNLEVLEGVQAPSPIVVLWKKLRMRCKWKLFLVP
ncbi:lipoamide dehydrogenase/acetyl-CoA carboxylase beta subunit fusion [Trifolium medium]|uniref:Lipoamide dehydrogenase/acetyl-CoA carboxylase beta subunit fusion n=1 Tax=Trifolium medium TaxID=97028 RepID=A0A392QWU8_9FABA|nr:lipoamide dehydrogenase/acetyl-CoA carboxylase beta subunit fusion [Trifolium medium]